MVVTSLLAPSTDRAYLGPTSEGIVTAEWNAHTKAVYGARFHPSGRRTCHSELDHTLKRWDLGSPDATCLRTLEGHKYYALPGCRQRKDRSNGRIGLRPCVRNGARRTDAAGGVCHRAMGTVENMDLQTGETQFIFKAIETQVRGPTRTNFRC